MSKIRSMVFIGILLGILFTFAKGTVIMLGIVIITAIALWNFLSESDRGFLIKLFIIGISLRIILFAILYLASIFLGSYGELTPDSRLYFLKTLDMIRRWTGQNQIPIMTEIPVGKNGYLYVLAFFYMLLGYNPTIPNPLSMFSDKLINCLIGTLSGILIFYIAKDIFGKKIAKISSIFTVFYPSLVFWSMTNSRESINIFLVCLIILSLIRLEREKKPIYFILILISLLILKTIRPYIFYSTLVVVGISFFLILWRNLKRKICFFLILSILLIAFLNLTSYGKMLEAKFLNFNVLIQKLYIANDGILSAGGPTYRIYDTDFLSEPSKFKLIKAFSKGLFYFMLVPFPWAISSMTQAIAYPQMIISYLMLPFILIGMLLAMRYHLKSSFSLIFYVLLVTFLFALTEGNVASAMRHRDLVLVFYLIFGAAGLVQVFDSKALIYNGPKGI